MDDFRTMPGHLIRRVQQISTALFAEETAGFDLTAVQYAALSAIAAQPGIDATRLSATIAFDRSTIGDVLERLELKGWVLRDPSPADRRIKLLQLSAAGRTLLDAVGPAVQRVQERLLAPLSANDRAATIRLLEQLAEQHSNKAPLRT